MAESVKDMWNRFVGIQDLSIYLSLKRHADPGIPEVEEAEWVEGIGRIYSVGFFFEIYYNTINQLRFVISWLTGFVLKEISIC